jgi:hypothetical protein
MRADVPFKIDGRECRLSMTLGALERLAETQPALAVLAQTLASGVWHHDEVRDVIAAGLHGAGEGVTYEDVYNAHGMAECHRLAVLAMAAVFGADMGNAFAAGMTPPAAGTEISH